MKSISRITKTGLRKQKLIKEAEFEALLNMLPQAVLVLAENEPKIIYANGKAVDLIGRKRSEIEKMFLQQLLDPWNENIFRSFILKDRTPTGGKNFLQLLSQHLIRPDGASLEVRVTLRRLFPMSEYILISLESEETYRRQQEESIRKQRFWESMHVLESAPQEPDFMTALTQAVEAGHHVTQAGDLLVFRAVGQNPGLQLCAKWGDSEIFPAELPALNLINSRTPQLWTRGKRAANELQRIAAGQGFAYLATAPLGHQKASIGLLVVADQKVTPPGNILALTQVLANTVTTIIQNQMLFEALREDNHSQMIELAINKTLEEAVQQGVLVLSPQLSISRVNPTAEIILGYTSSEVIRQPVEKVVIGAEALIPALKEAQSGHPTYNLGNIRLLRRNGETFLAHVSTLPVIRNGKVLGIVVMVQDLNEQEIIRERTQQLEQRALLGEVTAIFAHEVRNPINNISTGLQWLGMSIPEDDQKQETIQRLISDCDRLEELMKSVLSFAKPTDYKMEPVKLEPLVRRLIEAAERRAKQGNIQFHVQAELNCPEIEGNVRALEQVFNNLINNAVQAMSETGGRLAVKIQQVSVERGSLAPSSRKFLEVSVADTGPGIPPEIQERIFQPFFTTKRTGSGLGLAVVKRIVTAHKGNIRVTSFPGGTVFQVVFPTLEPIDAVNEEDA